jgi:hypothetical protein
VNTVVLMGEDGKNDCKRFQRARAPGRRDAAASSRAAERRCALTS